MTDKKRKLTQNRKIPQRLKHPTKLAMPVSKSVTLAFKSNSRLKKTGNAFLTLHDKRADKELGERNDCVPPALTKLVSTGVSVLRGREISLPQATSVFPPSSFFAPLDFLQYGYGRGRETWELINRGGGSEGAENGRGRGRKPEGEGRE